MALRTGARSLSTAMKLSELLREDLVLYPLEAPDKWAAINTLARAAVEAGALTEAQFETARDALVRREQSMTTGMEHGIAIPHAAVDGIDEIVAVLGISPEGIPFEALDGKPARILVCLVIPRAKKLLHIKTMAEIARLLNRAEVREELVSSGSAEAALERIQAQEREPA